jgi:hypothetical protein
MDDEQRQKIQDIAKQLATGATKASAQMRKYLLVVIGTMMYIAYIVLANVFYSPNYRACMERGGTLWSLANAIVHAFFMVCLFGYVARQCVGPQNESSVLKIYLDTFDTYVVQVVGLCVLFMLISYGLLFYRCMNPLTCAGCSPAQQTPFNTLVTVQVNRGTTLLKDIRQFYRTAMQDGRTPISTCSNYYNGSFREGSGKTTCATAGDMPECISSAYVDNSDDPLEHQTGPILSQFFVMTSGCTCVVSNHYDGYMSPVMIKIALDAGARCLDFNIANYSYSTKSFPVVTITRDDDKRNLQHNFVLFEDAMKTLSTEWLKNRTGSTKRDPLFLRLCLNAGVSKDCMDDIAYLVQFYLNEQHGNHLLPAQWQYKTVEASGGMGRYALCNFFDRIIIMVHSPHRTLSPLLEGLVNIYTGKGHASTTCETREWKNIKDKNTQERVEHNRLNLTYVETSFHPYSLVDNRQRPNSKLTPDDGMWALLLNKQSINNSPMPPFVAGCQFIAMNLQNIDDDLKLYLSVFEKSSFILKPRSMWPTSHITPPEPPEPLCNADTETPYIKKTESSCWFVCAPKANTKFGAQNKHITPEIHTAILTKLSEKGYTKLTKRTDACTIASKWNSVVSDATEQVYNNIDLVRREYTAV